MLNDDAPAMNLRQLAREQDYERYLLALLQPETSQDALWTLLCFSSEIARIPDLVSQEMVGLIRLTWWRERLDDAYADRAPYPHAVVQALHRWIAMAQPPRAWLDDMIAARQEQVGRSDIETMDAFQAFASGTAGRLAALMAYAVCGNHQVAETALPIGTAYGMLGQVRAAPFALARGIVLLPGLGHVQAAHPESLPEEACRIVAEIREIAEGMLVGIQPVDAFSRLHVTLVRLWVQQVRRAGDNIFSLKMQKNLDFLLVKLLVARLLKKS
jgi:phytoene/squalene synthetase